jgi:glycosyltransferase involved in cell wall biosynthesis
MIRVLMLNNEFPPLGGGTGTVNQAILDRLAALPELRIDAITSALGREREESRYAERVTMIKVPVNNRNLHHSSARELIAYAWRALDEARRRHALAPYDICFAWSAVPAGWVALRLKRALGLRYLVRVCGVDIPGFEARYRYVYPVLTPVLRAVWREADMVVAKCRGETDMIRAVDASITPAIIPNGVDTASFCPSSPPSPGEPLRVVCVGRLIERKGQRRLIEAVARLAAEGRRIEVQFVGTGDSEPAYRRLVAEKHVEDRVTFAGYVPRERIARHYAAAHVFVLPSDNEGMSVSTLEAMAAGLPLVVSRTGGTEELVEEGVNGVTFDPGDTSALMAALRELAAEPERVARMGRASLARARAFGWEQAAARYARFFETLTDDTEVVPP